MASITTGDWLRAWESCSGLEPSMRAVELLRTACAAESPERLASLPLGHRDALLVDLRQALFGRRVACLVACPACAVQLGLEFDVARLRAGQSGSAGELTLEYAGYRVRFRLPNSFDQARLSAHDNLAEARRALLGVCVLEAIHEGRTLALQAIPDDVVTQLTLAMGAADPQAVIGIELHCPECDCAWEADFDIAGFVWRELDNWARRVLLQVHGLASAYGWTERECLTLSAARRAIYLELAAA